MPDFAQALQHLLAPAQAAARQVMAAQARDCVVAQGDWRTVAQSMGSALDKLKPNERLALVERT
jgi:hypothetical protein